MKDKLRGFFRGSETSTGVDDALRRAVQEFSEGRHETALGILDQVLTKRPNDPDVLKKKCVVLMALGRLDQALVSVDLALKYAPNDAELWDNRGSVLRWLGQTEAALASYVRATDLDPGLPEAWLNRGDMLKDASTEDAITCYDKGLAVAPALGPLWRGKGEALALIGRHEGAIECYNQALRIMPNDQALVAVRRESLAHYGPSGRSQRALSQGSSLYTLVAAVAAAGDAVPGDWQMINEDQKRLLQEFLPECIADLTAIPELTAKAGSWQAVLDFLAVHNIRPALLAPPIDLVGDQGQISAAAVLDIALRWPVPGNDTAITSALSGAKYRGVRLWAATFHQSVSHPDPIARLETVGGDVVSVTACRQPPGTGAFPLVDLVRQIEVDITGEDDFSGVIIPELNWEDARIVGWLDGMAKPAQEDGRGIFIDGAFTGTRMRLDKQGTEVQTYTVLPPPLAPEPEHQPPPPLVIDGPFLVWISRGEAGSQKLSYPLFIGYFDEDDSWIRLSDVGERKADT